MAKIEKTLVVGVISFMLLMGLVAVIQPAKAQFVLADYEYSSKNDGNAIAYIQAYFDSEYNDTMYYDPEGNPHDIPEPSLIVEAGVNITLAVFCWVNGTSTGISSLAEGLDIMRHNVTVTIQNGTVIFSQQNFTYIVGTDSSAPMYFYRLDVILDFVPEQGQIYRVTVTYEVFY